MANAVLFERDPRTGRASQRLSLLARSPVRFIEAADIKGFCEHTITLRRLHMA